MIPIGPFSELSGLSIKTLRRYHEQGLLVPERVDEQSLERAYSAWQLLRAARISALRRAGVPVAVVKRLVEEPERAAELLGTFERATAERRSAEDAALAEARAVLGSEPRVELREAPRELAVTLPSSAELGTITLATAHLVSHEVPGYFVDVARMRRESRGDETEFAAPLVELPAPADSD